MRSRYSRVISCVAVALGAAALSTCTRTSATGGAAAGQAIPATPAAAVDGPDAAAPTAPPPVSEDRALGTPHPTVLLGAAGDGSWLAICQAREDTDHDGHIEVGFGVHGESLGDRLVPYLLLRPGPGREITRFLRSDRSGRWLFAASYGGNKITVNAIDKDGLVGPVQQLISTRPNAHAIHADAANRYVFATSLGGDNISAWRFDATTGTLSANDPDLTTAPAKSGPRHFVWDAAQKHVYLLSELDGSLAVFDYEPARGALREVQRTTALPAGFAGKPWAADLHFAPDGRHLYASERTTSTIAVYEVDAGSGQLKTLASVPTEKTPRGFAIDPSGRYLVASGQESHAIAVYAIDPASGALAPLQRYTVGKNPNWVEIVELP